MNMTLDVNGRPSLSEEPEALSSEEEAQKLGLWLPPEAEAWPDIGEIQAQNWRDYQDIATNSLWIIGSRSRDGVHTGKYHGNFVPQIPYQAIRRFTKPGEVVLDLFLGSGTTLIECRRLGRNGLGVELVDTIAHDARNLIEAAENPHHTWQEVINGDSAELQAINEARRLLKEKGHNKVQMLMMHPPYHDIIKFSDKPGDLSNMPTVDAFLEAFKKVVYQTYDLLEQKRFLVVVIGDTYSAGEWIPLGFLTMEAVQSVGYTLKSLVVKNMEGNRAKRNLQNLWRQRAFRGNYYIFKHEYVLFFQKTEKVVAVLEEVTGFVRQIDAREGLNLIGDSSFATGEALNRYLSRDYTFIASPRILVLKQGAHLRAVVINLTRIELRPGVVDELQNFLGELPESVVDVSILAEPEKKTELEQVRGVSQVYTPDERSLEQLAHALYVVRKATGARAKSARI